MFTSKLKQAQLNLRICAVLSRPWMCLLEVFRIGGMVLLKIYTGKEIIILRERKVIANNILLGLLWQECSWYYTVHVLWFLWVEMHTVGLPLSIQKQDRLNLISVCVITFWFTHIITYSRFVGVRVHWASQHCFE